MMKKRIKPHSAIANGKMAVATSIAVRSVDDNLFNFAQFRVFFYDAAGVQCGEVAFELNGEEEYTQWDASPEGIFDIAVQVLGLEFEPVVGSRFFEG